MFLMSKININTSKQWGLLLRLASCFLGCQLLQQCQKAKGLHYDLHIEKRKYEEIKGYQTIHKHLPIAGDSRP